MKKSNKIFSGNKLWNLKIKKKTLTMKIKKLNTPFKI